MTMTHLQIPGDGRNSDDASPILGIDPGVSGGIAAL